MTPNTPTPGTTEEEDLAWIKSAIGHMTPNQEATIRQALNENAAGTHALAATIAQDPNVRSPIAVLTYGIKQGKHTKPRTSPRTKAPIGKPLDKAHKLFTGKLNDLEATPWTQAERIEFAIDYALDHCSASGQALLDTEHQLRAELHAPRWTPTDAPPTDPAKYTEHHHLMKEAHGETWDPSDVKPPR